MTASAQPARPRVATPAAAAAPTRPQRPPARPSAAPPPTNAGRASKTIGGRINRSFMKMQFTVNKRIALFRMLASLLRNQVTIGNALEQLIAINNEDKRSRKTPEAFALREWLANMKGYASTNNQRRGNTFAEAIADWVTPAEVVIITAGQNGGRLPNALEDVIVMLGGMKKIRGSIITAVAYPTAIVAAIFGVLGIFAYQVLPAFAQILPYSQWAGKAYLLYVMASLTKQGAIPLAVLLAGLVYLFMRSLPRWRGRFRAWLDLRPPYSLYRLWNGIGFLLALAALMRAGVSATDALKQIRIYSNPWIRERVDACIRNMEDGSDAADALHRSRLNFPDPDLLKQMRIFAKNSDFSDATDRIAREALDQTVITISAQATVINIVLLVALTAVIGTIGLGIYELQDQVTGRAGM